MTDLIYKLYDECLVAGMMPEQFWNSTHYDIISFLQARNKATKNELKAQAKMLYNISLNIGSCVNGKTISYNKLFPSLREEESNQTQPWQAQKETVRKFAEKYNLKKKLEREAKNDAGRTQCQDNSSESTV